MDELLIKQMPHSTEAEQAVVGSMLIDPRCIGDVCGVVKADDFYSETNKLIFETIYSMFSYSMTIDAVTVLEQMRINGTANDRLSDYMIELMNITPTAANVMEYAAIVRDKALLRNIADAGAAINNMAMTGVGTASDILESSEQKIYALRQGRNTTGLMPVSTVMVDVYAQLAAAAKTGNNIPGLSTGLPDLDAAIMGLNNSDLILIAARPGMGKTSIALNIALHVAKTSNKAVAIFSLEMSREQLALRLLSSESFIHNKKLQSGMMSPDEWKKLARAAASISAVDMRLNDNPMLTVADMSAQCRRVQNLGLVVIDYLQLMQSATGTAQYAGESRTQVVSDISRMLKIMAKELNVPVICLSQMSRASETRQNKRPVLSDLRESGAIEQDADIVLALYRDDYYNKDSETPNLAECIVLKNRRGETGTIELQWLPEFTTYSSVERRYSDEDIY